MPSSLEWECRASGRQSSSIPPLLFLLRRSLALTFSNSASSAGRQAGRHTRDQVYPSSAPLSSKMPPHLTMGLSSQTNPREQPELGAPWGRPVGIGRIEFLTSPAPILGILSIHPTPGLLPHHPVLRVPSPDCEGTPARAPPAGPSSALRRPTMLGSRAPWRSRSRETATAAQVTRRSLACPQRCSPGAVRKDGLASE